MVPIHLKIEGLYSYQGMQEVDFTQLTQAQIFGIFGATGSGKSSILEAITFALYGQSSRLNQQDKRGYNMMNLKSKRLYIEFDFSHGEKRYKFSVEGKRNSKRFEQVGTMERKVYEYEGEQLIPSKLTNAEEITGLSYENFCRTIIIPQGKFQEFLQLTETERTRMLKEIFKLEKFELYRKTVSLDNKNKENITRQETLLLQLENITEEALRNLQSQTKELETQLQKEKSEQEKLAKELNKLEEIKALGEELEKQKLLVQGLENEEASFQQREERLKNYESCLVDFKPLLDKRAEDALSFSKNEQNLQLKREDRDENIKELEKAEAAFQQVKTNYESREQYLKRAEEFELVIQLKESAQNIGKLEERIGNGEEFTHKQKRDLEQMRLDLTNKSAEIRKLREERPEMEQIIKLKDWFNQKESREKELELNRKQVEEIQKEEVDLADEKAALLKSLPLHISQYKLETDQLLQLGKQRLSELQKQYEAHEQELEAGLGQIHLLKYAQELKDGESCPLCGSVHHPSPYTSSDTELDVESLREQILLSKQQILLEEKAQLQLQVLGDKESKLRQKKIEAEAVLSKSEQERDKHEAQFVWKDFDKSNPEQSQKILQELSATDIQINLLNQEWEALEKSIEKEDQTRDRYLTELEKIKKLREKERIQYESQIAKIVHIEIEKFIDQSNTELEKNALQEKELYKGIEDLFSITEQQILQKRSRVDVLKGEIAELEKQEKSLTRKMADSNLQLEERLKKSSFKELESIESLLGENINIDSEKQQIHQFRQDLLTAKNTLKNLADRIQNNSVDLDKYDELNEKLRGLSQKIEDISLEIGGQRKEIKRVENELKRKAEIEKELQKLQLRAEDIRTLKQLFFKSGFVNYVSSIFLRNLCLAANERFRKLTRGSLSLEPTEGNSFEVRDMLNDGQLRSVKTLSGGQTFQAALSLAIALADQVQQQAMTKQNFFFLDEGFGSQDQKSLQIIFQTLKSLRKESRIVGVISHVEELHQEIDTFLHIENDPTNGSKIRYSWQ